MGTEMEKSPYGMNKSTTQIFMAIYLTGAILALLIVLRTR